MSEPEWTQAEIDDLSKWVHRLEAGLKRHPEFVGSVYGKPLLEQLAKDEEESGRSDRRVP